MTKKDGFEYFTWCGFKVFLASPSCWPWNSKLSRNKIEKSGKLTWSYLHYTATVWQVFENEVDSSTGNGNAERCLEDLIKYINKIKWIWPGFWRILRIWNHCLSFRYKPSSSLEIQYGKFWPYSKLVGDFGSYSPWGVPDLFG